MRLRFRIVFWTAIICVICVAGLAAWSLSQLYNGIQLRRDSYLLQGKLDKIFVALQHADNSFLLYKLQEDDEEYTRFLKFVEVANQELQFFTRMRGQSKQIQSVIHDLNQMMEKKFEVTKRFVLDEDDEGNPKIHSATIVRDDLLVTKSFQVKLDELDALLEENVNAHQKFIDRFFDITMGALVMGLLFGCSLLIIFSALVSGEIRRRMRLEIDLRQAQTAAISASALKSQFLATVSHEIRTPLNGIIGMSEILRERVGDFEQKRFVDVIHKSGKALLRIVNDILDMSKIEANKFDIEIQAVEPKQIVESAIELLSKRALEKGIYLSANYGHDFELTVATDGSRIAQVLQNLLANAIKFTSSGSVELIGRSIARADDAQDLEFSVEDTGMGIPESRRAELFLPFSQISRQDGAEGSGLGLAISKRLVEMLGGEIGYEPRPERGSRFWFRVPVRRLQSPENISRQTREKILFSEIPQDYPETLKKSLHRQIELWPPLGDPQGAETRIQFSEIEMSSLNPFSPERLLLFSKRKQVTNGTVLPRREREHDLQGRILLVEDNETNRLLAQTQLESLGFQVDTVNDGEACLRAIESKNYSLILMDCQMPILDGISATKKIREREAQEKKTRLPIIAMTANAISGDRERCLAAGMDDYLSKPFELADLENKIAHWLNRKEPAVVWSSVRDLVKKIGYATTEKLLESLLVSLQKASLELDESLKKNDRARVAALAHSLKASALSLGAKRLGEALMKLEQAALDTNAENDKILALDLVASVQREMLLAMAEINARPNDLAGDSQSRQPYQS